MGNSDHQSTKELQVDPKPSYPRGRLEKKKGVGRGVITKKNWGKKIQKKNFNHTTTTKPQSQNFEINYES